MIRQASRPRSGEAGFSLIEVLVSTAIMMAVTGAIFGLMNPAQDSAQAQPEVADMQQRMRVGSETLFKELVMAGAGPYQGPVRGSLLNYFAPIIPRRLGRTAPDTPTTFRSDAITLSYVPNTYSQTTISQPMPNVSAELKVNQPPNCPSQNLCGFTEGMEVIIFDNTGSFDVFTITQVQASASHLQHRGQDMSRAYDTDSTITQIVSNTFFLDRATNRLMRDDGGGNILPIVDNVVDLRFEYFGDPNPPRTPDPGQASGVANCLYDAAHNYIAGLPTLTADEGSLASLPGSMLTDGPWCGGGTNQFDADLMRIRKVRMTYRVQAANPALRGVDTRLFMNPGTSRGGEKYIADFSLSFDVTPRNLNLTR